MKFLDQKIGMMLFLCFTFFLYKSITFNLPVVTIIKV